MAAVERANECTGRLRSLRKAIAEERWGDLRGILPAAASGYHGYKRNQSVGWAVGWFVLGGMFPIVTPVIAVAHGFTKPAK